MEWIILIYISYILKQLAEIELKCTYIINDIKNILTAKVFSLKYTMIKTKV